MQLLADYLPVEHSQLAVSSRPKGSVSPLPLKGCHRPLCIDLN